MRHQERLVSINSGYKLVLLFVLIIVAAQTSESQPSNKAITPVCSVYINHQGKVELKLPFTSAQPFSEGLAAIEQNDKIGYIDKKGKWIIQPQFAIHRAVAHALRIDGRCELVTNDFEVKYCSFSEDLAAVPLSKDKVHRWGYINQMGNIVIPARFKTACPFHDDLALVGINGSIQFIDKEGHVVGSSTNITPSLKGSDWLYPNTRFSEGLAPILTTADRFGYIDKKGKFAIEPKFLSAHPFHEGMACATQGHTGDSIKILGQSVPHYVLDDWHFIDPAGHQLFGKTFQDADDFSEGVAPVKINGKWGFIDKNGKPVIKPQFDRAFPFSDGLACIQSGTKYGCINHKGVMIIKPIYNRQLEFRQGLAPITELP